MLQQIIAIIVCLFFSWRLWLQKSAKQITASHFWLWQIFWLAAIIAIIFIKTLDKLTAANGWSASGIQILLYLAVIILFYLVFNIKLAQEKYQRDLTKIIEHLAKRR